jgi:hypothetical protein
MMKLFWLAKIKKKDRGKALKNDYLPTVCERFFGKTLQNKQNFTKNTGLFMTEKVL